MNQCEKHTDTCVNVAEAMSSAKSAYHRLDEHDVDIKKNSYDVSEVKGDIKEIKKSIGIYSALGAGGINIVIELIKNIKPITKTVLSFIAPDIFAEM